MVLGKHAQNRCSPTFLQGDTCHKKCPHNVSLSIQGMLVYTSQTTTARLKGFLVWIVFVLKKKDI